MGRRNNRYNCNKCDKLEKCAMEMAARNQKLIECINKKINEVMGLQQEADRYLEKAECLFAEAEDKTKEVKCLVKKLEEMVKATDCAFVKAAECWRNEAEANEEDDDDCDLNGRWNCR